MICLAEKILFFSFANTTITCIFSCFKLQFLDIEKKSSLEHLSSLNEWEGEFVCFEGLNTPSHMVFGSLILGTFPRSNSVEITKDVSCKIKLRNIA